MLIVWLLFCLQVLTMVDNIKETQVELKERRSSSDWTPSHRKQASKDSTSSADTQQSDLSHSERIALDLNPLPSKPDSKNGGAEKTAAQTKVSAPPKYASIQPSPMLQSPSGAGGKTKTAMLSSQPGVQKPTKRPEALGAVHGLKKPLTQLRFAKDAKKLGAGKGSGGDSKLGSPEVLTPPQSLNLSDSVTIDIADFSSPAVNEKTIIDEIKESTPQCWRHLYHLLELYTTMPEPKTITRWE
jgi:hypothetical protein